MHWLQACRGARRAVVAPFRGPKSRTGVRLATGRVCGSRNGRLYLASTVGNVGINSGPGPFDYAVSVSQAGWRCAVLLAFLLACLLACLLAGWMLACLWVHDRRFHLLLSLVACFAGAGVAWSVASPVGSAPLFPSPQSANHGDDSCLLLRAWPSRALFSAVGHGRAERSAVERSLAAR
ncbi:hypothetical protein IWX90DRAFT_441375, partial [Phyllosticta citrichinensis]